MCSERATVIDFVAEGDSPDEWKMVLVEEGPWNGPLEAELRRLQGRMYGCLDAALDGQLADVFPKSLGRRVVIQLDCYDLPRADVEAFFQRFTGGILATEDYRQALQKNEFVRSIGFAISFNEIAK